MQSFNPHTHEGCDLIFRLMLPFFYGFNPHTHEGCDAALAYLGLDLGGFNPHTHEGCDYGSDTNNEGEMDVSIHTPTKGVTSSPDGYH